MINYLIFFIMHAIDIRHARKTYANGFTALHDVSFTVAPGEFFALLGPNGAGKTTLISAMAGLIRLSAGDIAIMGHDVRRDAHAARRALGVVPQELVFDPFFTVREALVFQSGYYGIRANGAWIDELLHHLGLADKASSNTRRLSGGMKRRLMVAQALVHRPPVIVLDEPTAGVDVELRHSLWHFMQTLNRDGHTIILTTHYLEEAQQNCTRIAMLKQGQLVALERTDTLLETGQGIAVEIRLARPLPDNFAAQVQTRHDLLYRLQLPDYAALTALFATLQAQDIAIEHLHILEQDLEQAFIRLTGAQA